MTLNNFALRKQLHTETYLMGGKNPNKNLEQNQEMIQGWKFLYFVRAHKVSQEKQKKKPPVWLHHQFVAIVSHIPRS